MKNVVKKLSKNKNKKTESLGLKSYLNVFLLIFITMSMTIVGYSVIIMDEEIKKLHYNADIVEMQEIDGITNIACSSDSMGLLMNCGDRLYYKDLKTNDELVDGEIYIFKSPYVNGTTAVHRLIWHNESHAIFKGDNNLVADPLIHRSDVLKIIVGIKYYVD